MDKVTVISPLYKSEKYVTELYQRISQTLNDPHIRFVSDADIEKIVNSKKPLIVTGSTYLIGYLFDKHMQYAFRNGRITL
mgnify:CR=1 FL=1